MPNLKKKASNKDRRLRMQKRKAKGNGADSKGKSEKWGELFFHYFEELLDRFVQRKLETKNGKDIGGRGRLMS